VTLNLSPVYTGRPYAQDQAASHLEYGIMNRWFLDAVLKGSYPADVLRRYEQEDLDVDLDISGLADLPPDFLGVNYYAPTRVQDEQGSPRFGIEGVANPDSIPSVLGEIYPEGLFDLLVRVRDDYGAPRMIITENGSGFGDVDEIVVEGRIHDRYRVEYLRDHLRQVHRALEAGMPVDGYIVWAGFDHFEFTNGYNRRYGLIHVDFDGQQRLWKDSAYAYQEIASGHRVAAMAGQDEDER
jgi:beta-glucosidase